MVFDSVQALIGQAPADLAPVVYVLCVPIVYLMLTTFVSVLLFVAKSIAGGDG